MTVIQLSDEMVKSLVKLLLLAISSSLRCGKGAG